MPVAYQNQVFTLSGGNVSYVLHVTEDRKLMNLYWGRRVPDHAVQPELSDYQSFASFDPPASRLPSELPVLGQGWYGTPAVDVLNAQGDHIVDLRVTGHRILPGKKGLPGLPAVYSEKDDEARSLEIDLADPLTGLSVTLQYAVYAESGAVTRSMRITNAGQDPVTLRGALSVSVPLWGADYDVLHLKGAWARERTLDRTPLGQGAYEIGSQRGASGHEENPFLALCGKQAGESSGDVWGVSFVYSGSFLAGASADNAGNARLYMGMNPQVFSWLLQPGESFQTPEAVLVYSCSGLNGMSRIYHRLYRTRLARGAWRDRLRPVLINNWEGTYFDFDEEKLFRIARAGKELGIELFVMDDGWFGRRNSDNCSLGDWTANPEKLPRGLAGLSERIHGLDMLFGIWMEPEMVSPDSDLYRAHPDWCLHVPGRARTEERNQLILDLSRKEVRETVTEAVSAVLRESRADYLKWDMNRNMTEYFSPVLPPERRMETQHRYMLGLYEILEEITRRFPDVLFESCSGGGGRFDPGLLYYMPQAWTSDNTDAIARLGIQYGTSLVYPASAMGAHVSAVPNHQCRRTTSMQMRGDVALCGGGFGFELDVTALPDEDKKEARAIIARAKELRGLVQEGTFWRLLPPSEARYAAWQFVREDGKQALLCVYRILSEANTPPVRVKMAGLDPEGAYRDESGKLYSGAALMYRGFSVSIPGDFGSCMILLEKVPQPFTLPDNGRR